MTNIKIIVAKKRDTVVAGAGIVVRIGVVVGVVVVALVVVVGCNMLLR